MRLLDASPSFSLRPSLIRGAVLLGLAAAGLSAAAADLSQRGTQTDGSVAADHQGFQQQQEAIRALNASGKHPLRSYSLSKAQCWLDVSFHEYTRNDRSAFPLESLRQSEAITRYLASDAAVEDAANPALKTPLVNGAAKLREDLWATAAKLKASAGARCIGQQLACAEVELVHAGNEHQQQGWRHAKPYIQMAEDLLAAAEQGEKDCPPISSVLPDPVKAKCEEKKPQEAPARCESAVPAKEPQKETVVLGASMLFDFDGRQEKHLRRSGLAQFDQLIARLKADYGEIQRIEVIGYTDRIGKDDYNVKLSQDRAEVIKGYLVRKGIDAKTIDAKGMGPANPVKECPGTRITEALKQCLEPNRRVELIINGTKVRAAEPKP